MARPALLVSSTPFRSPICMAQVHLPCMHCHQPPEEFTDVRVDDVNYHGVGDTIKNLNVGAWLQNTKAIAHAVATYAVSFASLGIGKREETIAKREEWKQEVTARALDSSSFGAHDVSARSSPVVDPPVSI